MPIYEYLCASCGYQFEEVQKFNEPPLEECPDCGKNSARRQVSMSALHLKGGGWYKDGYGVKAADDAISKTDDSGEKETKKEDSKKETKSESNSNKESKKASDPKEKPSKKAAAA